jgi:hypothetical protein
MKVGDLVRDKDYVYASESKQWGRDLGIIVSEDKSEGMYKVVWNGRGKEWLTEMYLELV